MSWTYAVSLLTWLALRLIWGDRLWWSALLSSFTPYLFLPLPVVLVLVLVTRARHRAYIRLAILIPTALFALLYGRLFLPKPHLAPRQDATLTVMTFNIWGGGRAPETARVVAEAGYPDIVALQELTPQMARVLLDEVGDAYPHRLLLPVYGHRGMGLLSRHPVEPLATPELARLEGCEVQAVRVSLPQGPILVYNVHPNSSNIMVFLEYGMPVAEGTRDSVANRAVCLEAVAAKTQAHADPVIVLGDFNATDQSDAYRLLTRSLRDAHRDAGWGFGHTFPAYGGSFRGIPIPPSQMRIDMILYTDDFRALSCRVSPSYGESDHRPVIAGLAWR